MTSVPAADRILADAVVANYLEANGHPAALASFLSSCTSHRDPAFAAVRQAPRSPTIDSLVFSHRLSEAIPASLSVSANALEWRPPSTSRRLPNRVTRTLKGIHASNILSVRQGVLPSRRFDTSTAEWASLLQPCILTSSVDKTIKFTSIETWDVLELVQLIPSSPVLAVSQHPQNPQLLLAGTMTGDLIGWDLVHRQNAFHVKDHTKYVVRIACNHSGSYVASTSYDGTIRVYALQISASSDLSDPFAAPLAVGIRPVRTLHVPTSPEALLWTPAGRAEGEWLLYSRREDCFVRGLQVPSVDRSDWAEEKWNINANGDLWVSYDIVDMALPAPQTHLSLLLTSAANRETPPRILLLPLFRAASQNLSQNPTLYTTASASPLILSRHIWSAQGDLCAVTGDDGCLCMLKPDTERKSGWEDSKVGAHGPAAPFEEGEMDEMEIDAEMGSERRREAARRVRERRKADKGSGVVRDLCVIDDARTGCSMIVTIGFDRTIRVIQEA